MHGSKMLALPYSYAVCGSAGSSGDGADISSIELSFIIQYFRHPSSLQLIIARLQHPNVEVVVHADSNTMGDRAAFEHVRSSFANVRILHSSDIHEVRLHSRRDKLSITALTKDCSAQVRGYNRAASVARGELLAFSQDDRLPPNSTAWVDAVIGAFRLLPSLAVLGLHRGSSRIFRRSSNVLYGSYLVS